MTISTQLHCPKCGLDTYFNPKPCTAVILVNDTGEYLLTKRAFEPAKGAWDFLGGFIEGAETFEANAVREVEEELGLIINEGSLHYVASHTEPYDFQDVEYPTIAVLFVAKFPAGAKPRPADDVANYKFFAPDELPYDQLAFKAMRKDLALVKDYLSKNRL
ncbi:NUDIX domain-containing protein [Candidatus Saccharibacteria bacterium]|nr:NUDIX domain-containing protein [Candidatus Saccharibacteria bacterium]